MQELEVVEVFNASGQAIGEMTREEAERDNHMTKNVLVFIFNSLGKVWTQLRPDWKAHYPNRWDISVCGGVQSGESPEQAAQRETREELGFEPKLQLAESFLNIFPGDNGEERKRLSYLFIGESDKVPRENDEVAEFKVWDLEELRHDVISNPDNYVPSFLLELDKAIKAYTATK